MCVGIPMQVISCDEASALCEGRGQTKRVDMLLVGHQPAGAWVLEFMGVARELLTEEQARQIGAALDALQAALNGDTDVDRFFPDLVRREPELPDFLKKAPRRPT